MRNPALLVLLWLCVLGMWPRILGYRVSRQLEETRDRDDVLLSTRNFSAGCINVRLLLSSPVHEFTALVSHSQGGSDAGNCLVTAGIPRNWSDDGSSQCDSHVWDVRGPQAKGVPYTQQLRLESSCSVGDMSLKVLRNDAATKRRLLADNTSPAANITSLNQTAPSSPSPASVNNQGPSNGIACCCGQNNQVGSSSQCCCGPISICCQSSGFCMTQNCTAIFVGSTLIAGALISFMTCGICIYRARSSLQDPALWARSGGRFRDQSSRRARRPLPVQAPPSEEEGLPRECPVCLEEITSNAQWVIFQCHHATCRTCFDQLVAKPHQDAACPLCRSLLTELVPEDAAPQVAVQMQPLHRDPAAQQAPAASTASTSRGPATGTS